MRWLITSSLVALLFSSAVAEEATDTVLTLTPEQAQEEIEYNNDYLSLDEVASLTPEVAAILAKHEGDSLSLPDLKLLTPDVAAALSAYKGELALDGLETLSAKAARELARHEGRLKISGISSLPDDAALAIAKHQGDLCMQSLRELSSDPLARRLLLAGNSYRVGGDGGPAPDRLTSISPEVAELLVIAEQDRDGLWLTELKSPSIEVLKVLARINGDLGLGVDSLSPEMVHVLAAQPGNLALPAAKEIDTATLAILATKEGGLELYLTTITPEVAMILSGFNGDLTLHVERLPEDVERALAKSKASLSIPELKEIKTGELARKLVEAAPVVTLHVERLTEDVERVLAQSNAALLIPELKEIKTGELARKLVEAAPVVLPGDGQRLPWSFEGWQLAVESLSPAVAEEIKAFRGLLMLRACESLPLDVEDMLSECEGSVKAPALRELKSVKLARKLAEHTEDVAIAAGTSAFGSSSGLELRNLSEISPDVAEALASHSGEYLLLDGLRSLSDEAAAGLAQFSGNLSLARVRTLSAEAQRLLGEGKVKLVGLASLDALTDHRLATKIVEVGGLKTVTAEVAAVLSKRSCEDRGGLVHGFGAGLNHLYLNLTHLTPDIAAALAAKKGDFNDELVLPALETIDADSASELAKCGVPLHLPGFKQLTPETAAAFAEKTRWIYLDGVEEIPVEIAKVLANKKEGYVSFTPNYGNKRKTTLKLPEQSADLLRNHKHIILPEDSQP